MTDSKKGIVEISYRLLFGYSFGSKLPKYFVRVALADISLASVIRLVRHSASLCYYFNNVCKFKHVNCLNVKSKVLKQLLLP